MTEAQLYVMTEIEDCGYESIAERLKLTEDSSTSSRTMYNFTIKNEQGDVLVDDVIDVDVTTTELLRAHVDLWGLFRYVVMPQIVSDDDTLTNLNMQLTDRREVSPGTFDITILYTYKGERCKGSFFIDVTEVEKKNILKDYIR